MLSFTTILVGGKLKKWSFDDIEALRNAYNSKDADVPHIDDLITEMTFCGVPMYVDIFGDILGLFGIEECE